MIYSHWDDKRDATAAATVQNHQGFRLVMLGQNGFHVFDAGNLRAVELQNDVAFRQAGPGCRVRHGLHRHPCLDFEFLALAIGQLADRQPIRLGHSAGFGLGCRCYRFGFGLFRLNFCDRDLQFSGCALA